jgi:hypothetical protein
MELLGEWRESSVLLHLPFGDSDHPDNFGPSAGIETGGLFQFYHMASRVAGYKLLYRRFLSDPSQKIRSSGSVCSPCRGMNGKFFAFNE